MKQIPEKLNLLLEELKLIDDENLRAEILIEYAEDFLEVPQNIAKRPFAETHRVPGCESEAFIWAIKNPDDSLKFYFAVENPQGISAKAMASILDQTLSGAALSEVSQIDEQVVYTIFGRTISMGKGQGLMNMLAMIKTFAKSGRGQDREK